MLIHSACFRCILTCVTLSFGTSSHSLYLKVSLSGIGCIFVFALCKNDVSSIRSSTLNVNQTFNESAVRLWCMRVLNILSYFFLTRQRMIVQKRIACFFHHLGSFNVHSSISFEWSSRTNGSQVITILLPKIQFQNWNCGSRYLTMQSLQIHFNSNFVRGDYCCFAPWFLSFRRPSSWLASSQSLTISIQMCLLYGDISWFSYPGV